MSTSTTAPVKFGAVPRRLLLMEEPSRAGVSPTRCAGGTPSPLLAETPRSVRTKLPDLVGASTTHLGRWHISLDLVYFFGHKIQPNVTPGYKWSE